MDETIKERLEGMASEILKLEVCMACEIECQEDTCEIWKAHKLAAEILKLVKDS